MDELSQFCRDLKKIYGSASDLNVNQARLVIKKINEFLYTNYPEIGKTEALGQSFPFLSDFHRYWEKNHKKILDAKIDRKQCEKVADALYAVYKQIGKKAFESVWDTCGLKKEDICRIRLLTANQDFRGSRKFSDFAEIFNNDKSIFDEEKILNEPALFLNSIKISDLSQNDKRIQYAKKISEFIISLGKTPYRLIKCFDNDIYKLREALINCQGAGYGRKKTDMFIRDMVVLKIWNNVKGFEKIDVASDVNTIKVALRTGILKTSIPLVSSFIDIFCHQYGYIDEQNALAWRTVWEIWEKKHPSESLASPCLLDYFIYNVIGTQFCKESLALFKCNNEGHIFTWHSSQNKTCQICYERGNKKNSASLIGKMYPCDSPDGKKAILNTPFVKGLSSKEKMEECPFKKICISNGTKKLQPPKSISISGRTGWTSAYSEKGHGGGGLMA
ncbi:MAG: hypothetical protein J6W54_11265 [Fibrobacter sp.]|uniref:hypothetical protein n=1 Tax=Fibrobacter sp. TaxID=35828 RepID=UPI001B2E14E9|nr:hypothetical protein [Fibrobacter sp.]MBO7061654.1 hypothetical protein [Fibrobacter sp.]